MLKNAGFTLTELLVILVLIVLITSIAVPFYGQYVDRANISKAIGDLSTFEMEIERFRLNNNDQLPPSLADLPIQVPLDPWDQPYVYTDIRGANVGAARKDGNLVPINSEFDLYSIGEDGQTAMPLNAKAARDDIVRANDGAYIGLAEDF